MKAEKEAQKIFPAYILKEEIDYQNNEVQMEIKRLKREGLIRVGETINSKFIEIL